MKELNLKINNVAGYDPGSTIAVKIDQNGLPLERLWRNRLKDAETDNCVEVVKASIRKPKKEQAE